LERIENRTFEEIKQGDTASQVRTLTSKDLEHFALVLGGVSPEPAEVDIAETDRFEQTAMLGTWAGTLISTVLGTELPGPDTIYVDQSLHFLAPVKLGDTVTVTVKVLRKIH
jgi:acyl dehydratase